MIPTYGTPGCAHPDKRTFGNGLAWCQDCGAVYDGVAWDTPRGQADVRVSNLEFQNTNLRARLEDLGLMKRRIAELLDEA